MNEQILVNITPQETRVAIVQYGALQELHVERTATRGIVSNVYLGKVVRVLPGMQSAFIDIGLEKAAFLHVADLWEHRNFHHNPKSGMAAPPVIEKMMFEGQSLIVQVIKDPIGTKGARLSTQISIAGRMLVHLPQDPHIGISQRIENEMEREQLRERLQRLMPPQEKGGFIIRTHAEEASEEELAADIQYLQLRWQEVLTGARSLPPASLLYQDLSLSERVVRDLIHEETDTIWIDSRENLSLLQRFAKTYASTVDHKLQHYSGERPLFELYNIEEEILKALGRRVELKSGGYIIIDQTEALTTVDVNTGGFVGARNFDDTIFKTNLEAAQAIARQLRLRNLGGIIIIDFIDMGHTDHQQAVLAELKKTLSRDRTRTTINGFSNLGLVEMTRKRTRESLSRILCEPCPTCEGKGQVKTGRTVVYEIMREIVRESRQFNPREFRILASPEVIDLFLEEEAAHLGMLETFVGKPITLQVDNLFHQEQYDIVLT